MGMSSFAGAGLGYDGREYESWLTTLSEASAHFDALKTAVTELQHLCQSQDVSSQQVLELLEKSGAITKPAARSVAA